MVSNIKKNHWRLLPIKFHDSYTNMAIDEAILRGFRTNGSPPTLRIYGWEPPGISLGFFQEVDRVLNLANCQSLGVSFVRRLTGGEAILHQDDITYSIICSKHDLELPSSVKESYKKICLFLINSYKALGLKADFFLGKQANLNKASSSFCLAKRQEFDIAIEGKKIGGNAQKRMKDIIFQHGSIPFKLNEKIINDILNEDLTGIGERVVSLSEATHNNVDKDKFSSILVNSFKEIFKIELIEEDLSSFELELAKRLKINKYQTKDWNYSRIGDKA